MIKKKGTNMAIDFSTINLEVIDLNTNATPDIFINQNCVSFSKRILEDLNYPQFVQFGIDAPKKIFAIRVCKGNENRATPFSKPKTEQASPLTISNKNLREVMVALIPEYASDKRYKITGEYDSANRTMYFDMTTAKESSFYRKSAE
jgi:hypothetical protein